MNDSCEATCHCGAVKIRLQKRPEYLHDCNCRFCQTSGAIWGYYTTETASVEGEVVGYTRIDKEQPDVAVCSCPVCGTTTHWRLTPGFTQRTGHTGGLGINMRLFPRPYLNGVELRFPDGEAWDSQPGTTTYRREPVILDETGLP